MTQIRTMMQKNNTSKGFTVVELIIVIIVIGILAGITIIGYGSWRNNIIESRVKSDAAGVYTGMQNARNFSESGYPTFPAGTLFDGSSATSSIFKASDDVVITYIEGSAAYFCVNVTSVSRASVKFFIDSRLGEEPKKGDCAAGEYDPSIVAVGQPLIFKTETMGPQSICGVGLDNKTYCAGRFIGDGSSVTSAYVSARFAGVNSTVDGSAISKISSGASQNCAIAASKVYCWGNFIEGDGTTANRLLPLKISGNGELLDTLEVTDISVANSLNASYACAIASARAYCWGTNTYGVLGNGTTDIAMVPTAVLTNGVLQNVSLVKVMTGNYRVAVLSDTGRLFMWGRNLPGNVSSTSPTEPAAFIGKKVVKVVMGNATTYVLTEDGNLYSWGSRNYGQQGDGTTGAQSLTAPTLVQQALAGKVVTDVQATASAACAVAEAKVYCWGRNHEGQLGIGSTVDTNVPTLVQGPLADKQVRRIASGSYSVDGQKFCAATMDNKMYCWGSGLIYGTTTVLPSSQSPVEITTLGNFR